MAAGSINWRKSKEEFIKHLYKKVVSSNDNLSHTSIDVWLEKYENDNEFRKLIDSKNVEKIEKFIAHQKHAFQCLLEKNPNHQSHAAKIGGPLGGEATKSKIIAELGEEGAKEHWREYGNKMYSNIEDKKAWHSAGGKKVTAMRKAEAMELCRRILDRLPIGEWFGVKEYEAACNVEGKSKTYFSDVRRFHFPDVVESNGARSSNAKCIIRKKTW